MLTCTFAQQLLEKYQHHFEELKSIIYTHSALEGAYIEKISSTLKSIAYDKVDQKTLLQNIIDFWELTKGNEGRFEGILNKYDINGTSKHIFKQFLNEKALIRHIIMYPTSYMYTHSRMNKQLEIKFPHEKMRNEFISAVAEKDNLSKKEKVFVEGEKTKDTRVVIIYKQEYGARTIFEPYIKNIEYNENVKKAFTDMVDVNLVHEQSFNGKKYIYYPLRLDLLAHDKNIKLNTVAKNSQLIYALANDKAYPTFFSCLPTDLNIIIASLTEEFQNMEEAEKIAMTNYKPVKML